MSTTRTPSRMRRSRTASTRTSPSRSAPRLGWLSGWVTRAWGACTTQYPEQAPAQQPLLLPTKHSPAEFPKHLTASSHPASSHPPPRAASPPTVTVAGRHQQAARHADRVHASRPRSAGRPAGRRALQRRMSRAARHTLAREHMRDSHTAAGGCASAARRRRQHAPSHSIRRTALRLNRLVVDSLRGPCAPSVPFPPLGPHSRAKLVHRARTPALDTHRE